MEPELAAENTGTKPTDPTPSAALNVPEMQETVEQLRARNDQLKATIRDLRNHITDLEAEVMEVGAYAKGIAESIREPLLVVDAGLRVKAANAAFCETFRMSEKSIVGCPLSESQRQ